MAKLNVSLSIGFVGGTHKDVIDIDDNEIEECKTEEELDELLGQYWLDWANNYIEGGFEIVE